MTATDTDRWPVATRPTNSRINLGGVPAASTSTASATTGPGPGSMPPSQHGVPDGRL